MDEHPEERAVLRIPRHLWEQTWSLLSLMGDGRLESACVWGGARSGRILEVKKVYPIGPAHGAARGELSHRMSLEGVSRLFEELRTDGHQVIADVHTHPEDWVGLSYVDMAHPIEFRIGLICLVLPWYGAGVPSLQGTGIHVYLGGGRWADESGGNGMVQVEVV